MIRWLINFRYAVHYGLNSDIELRRKSANATKDFGLEMKEAAN
jgi:hypothetical protein